MGMHRKTVLLDCDGPMSDFTGAYLDAFREVTGRKATHADVDRWAIHECSFFTEADRVGGWDGRLRKEVAAKVIEEGFCARIKPHAAALDAIPKLCEVADVYVVTSPWDSSPTWMYERLHWVANHFPGIGRRRVIQTAQKHLIRGDVLVDDKPSHVRDWQNAWPNGLGLLFDMHHNGGEQGLGLARTGWPFVLKHCGAAHTPSQAPENTK